jgi:hypothetical protein
MDCPPAIVYGSDECDEELERFLRHELEDESKLKFSQLKLMYPQGIYN